MKKAISLLLSAALIAFSSANLTGCEIVHLNDITEEEEATTPATEAAADIVFTPPEPEYPYIVNMNTERIMDIDASQLANLNYEGARVEYVYSTEFTTYIIREMGSDTANRFFNHLKNLKASPQVIEDHKPHVNIGYKDFRITLNTGEKIYLYFDEIYYPDGIGLNTGPYKCDTNTLEKLNSMKK